MAEGIEVFPSEIIIKADLPMYKTLGFRRAHRTCIMSIDNKSINFQQYSDKKRCNGEIFNIRIGDITGVDKLKSSIKMHFNNGVISDYIEISNCDKSDCTIDFEGFKRWFDNLKRLRSDELNRLDKAKFARREAFSRGRISESKEAEKPYSTEVFFNPKTSDELLSTLRAKIALEDRERLAEIERKSVADELSVRLDRLRGGRKIKRKSSLKKRKSYRKRINKF